MPVVVLWFRHGLRMHDNPSLHEAIAKMNGREEVSLLPLFIFDGETAGTKICGWNRFQFLLECLQDLDEQFGRAGGRLHLARGRPTEVLEAIRAELGLEAVCFEQDCEPVWKTRDEAVKAWCDEKGVEWVESVGHTLWNPHEVISLNGGTPPVTFSMFGHVIQSLGRPDRPAADVDLKEVRMLSDLPKELASDIKICEEFPTPETFGVTKEHETAKVYVGGETRALQQLEVRLELESKAFAKGSFLPNQRDPDILCPPKSLSPDLRFGSLSVRKFYWGLMDAFKASQKDSKKPFNPQIVAQLIWREFFYTMSVNNPYYDEMERNEICINVPWYPHEDNDKWYALVEARTGYPFIDAGMRQLYKEGWIHHVVRNAIACFLTRGDLWISWEPGLKLFLKNLLDADWSVCAGNWMWISSSAFEQVLSCRSCVDPATYGRRSDPWGEYVKRYVPEVSRLPVEYLYEPWRAPAATQAEAGCVLGRDYPHRVVVHEVAVEENRRKMEKLKDDIMKRMREVPRHCAPSDEAEIRSFMSFPESCKHGRGGCGDGACGSGLKGIEA